VLPDSAYLPSAEYEALGGEDSSPEGVARGQGESIVNGVGQDTAVGWTDDSRTGDLVDVQAVLRPDLDTLARF